MTISTCIERYRQQLLILNRSPETQKTTASYLRLLQRFLDEMKISDVQCITGTTVQEFQRWLFYRPTRRGTLLGPASQNRVLASIKGFFAFLHQEGFFAWNPADQLTAAREPETLPRDVLTPQEARRIIEQPDTGTEVGYRDRTILEVLYATGLRKSELMHLTVGDVNLEEELLRINRGKGGKDRVSPLSRLACNFLENYIKFVRPEMLSGFESDRLFISMRHRPISKNAVDALVQRYALLAKVKKHVTCHLWRHTCATHLLKNRANLRHVQEILGHRSLATTERYLHLTINDLKAAHRRFHPREKCVAARRRGTHNLANSVQHDSLGI